MLQFYRSLLCVQKIRLFWLSESLSCTILLEMHTHEHILTYTLGQEWLIYLHVWDAENKSSHLSSFVGKRGLSALIHLHS